MGALQRFFGGPSRRREAADAGAAPRSRAGSYSAIQRERELHRLILIEMERRGPEVTAEDLYDEIATEWDRQHADPGASANPAAAGAADPAPASAEPAAASAGPAADAHAPSWLSELVAEQRTTNRLLAELLEQQRALTEALRRLTERPAGPDA